MSFLDIRIRAYKRLMQPLQPYLYSFVCTYLNLIRSADETPITWNDGQILIDAPIEDERERGRVEAGVKWLTFFLLLIPVFGTCIAVFSIEDATPLWYVSSALFFVFAILLLASTHGLETPTIRSYEEVDPS